MKKILFVIITLCVYGASCQNQIPQFDHYGVYIDTPDGFVELKTSCGELPVIQSDSSVTIVVYDPGAKQHTYRLIQGLDQDGSRLRSSYETETVKTPLKDNDELLKLTAPVFGGVIALVDENTNYKYAFFVENPTIKQSLMKWMVDNINAYKEKNFQQLLPFWYTKRELSGLSDSDMNMAINQLSTDKRLQRDIEELEVVLDSLQSGKEQIEFLPREGTNCIGVWDYCVYFNDGSWEID